MKFNPFKSCTAALFALSLTLSLAPAQDRQSPVDFTSENTQSVAKLPKVKVSMSKSTILTVKNTWNPSDHSVAGEAYPKEFCSVKATVPAGAGTVSVDGKTYNLLQFHFHTPSEHSINDERAPMEVHFVCLDSTKQLGEPDSLLVVGAWIVKGEESHEEFDKIFSNLPTPNATVTVTNFNLASVFPATEKTFRYLGGLTAPTYVAGRTPSLAEQIDADIFPEIVNWVVSDQRIKFSTAQIEAFQALFPEEVGNSREVQPIAGRKVLHDSPTVK